jgi:hypothetical protein
MYNVVAATTHTDTHHSIVLQPGTRIFFYGNLIHKEAYTGIPWP